jgi:hypothetical protein
MSRLGTTGEFTAQMNIHPAGLGDAIRIVGTCAAAVAH